MTPHASITPAPTLAEVSQHARLALARKPCPLDLELLAQDVLWLVGRVEAAAALLEEAREALGDLLAYVPGSGATIRAGYGEARGRAVDVLAELEAR